MTPTPSRLNALQLVDLAGEEALRIHVLTLLYSSRRETPDDPGVSLLEFEKALKPAREQLMFTVWYLRDRGYLAQDENSNFVITGNGVDFLEQHLRESRKLTR